MFTSPDVVARIRYAEDQKRQLLFRDKARKWHRRESDRELISECERRALALKRETGECPGVYVIARDGGTMKIGMSRASCMGRLRALQTAIPEKLELLGILS